MLSDRLKHVLPVGAKDPQRFVQKIIFRNDYLD